ncbi:glycosyltransferase family 2 protein [Mariniflexile sp.]|uniref:glycosyltransferase family 2 protein n=1 Tax=Mariniflexile sp. TaxID=1979402 RepID=UPI0035632C7C
MIELSVHLITFNNAKHIEATLQSILSQKVNFDFEIVVGDDCSTDNTLEIINRYKEKQPALFNVKKNTSQLGILKNFKATLDRCQGTYIFDIAGDDLFKGEDTLQKMVDTLKTDESLGFVDSGYDLYLETKNKSVNFDNAHLINISKEAYKTNILLGKVAPVGVCYNRSFLYKYVDFEKYMHMNVTIEDYPILVDLVMHTNFETINESLHIYRVHDASCSHQKRFDRQLFLLNQMHLLFTYFSKKYHISETIRETFEINHNKQLLYYAGYFEKKDIGKIAFKKIASKNLKDYIHYYASQIPFFRKLISIF